MMGSMLLEPLHPTRTPNRSIVVRIIDEMIRSDLLDLVVRVLLQLKPIVETSSDEYGNQRRCILVYQFRTYLMNLVRNCDYRESIQKMFGQLAKLVPQELLESYFQNYVPDLMKYRQHLAILALCMADIPHLEVDPHFLHYGACFDAWKAIWRSLGQKSNVKRTEDNWASCSYPRCARIIGVRGFGVPFACSGCASVTYCSVQCQSG